MFSAQVGLCNMSDKLLSALPNIYSRLMCVRDQEIVSNNFASENSRNWCFLKVFSFTSFMGENVLLQKASS